MKVIGKEHTVCASCMNMHDVQTVNVMEKTIFKGLEVNYSAVYQYCEFTNELTCDETMISQNDISMKNEYRKQCDLLTSNEIMSIRDCYFISQKDLSLVLGWGEKTITRYEGHQVQDQAHDKVLRKIADDPEWFLTLLENGKDLITDSSYQKCKKQIIHQCKKKQESYLKKAIFCSYLPFIDHVELNGNKELDLAKVVDVIRYFSDSCHMKNLYLVKLLKCLWYSDFLSYKTYGKSMTGLVYSILPMGAVPVDYKTLMKLDGIHYEEEEYDYGIAYRFCKSDHSSYESLTENDLRVLDCVIHHFGDSTKSEIVDRMHFEKAFTSCRQGDFISYVYAKDLSISL